MLSFSANFLFLLLRTEYSSYAVFLMHDLESKRVYQNRDLQIAQLIRPRMAHCVAGNVSGIDKNDLVVESVKTDPNFAWFSMIPIHADGAGGWAID